jgi:DNA-binding NarL/FixJ family response regulator
MDREETETVNRIRRVRLITQKELETLRDVAQGLSDGAIAQRRNLTKRGVQSRISSLMQKLLDKSDPPDSINSRCRIVFEGLRQGLLDLSELQGSEEHGTSEESASCSVSTSQHVWVLGRFQS